MDGGSMRQVLKSASRDGKIPVPEDSAAVAISKLKKMRKKLFQKHIKKLYKRWVKQTLN